MTPSTPRLSEVARHLVVPDGIVSSVWPRVERRLASVGVDFDQWQHGFGSVALGCRADGTYAATVGGVVASIPRQVGKTFTVGNLLIGLAAEFPGMRIIWTSHHARTTTNTFRSMQGRVQRKALKALIAPNGIRVANGEQEIRFRNGSIIMFGAREHGFGRGLDAIDILVFDEAQILSLKALEDMVPATNQAQHPHGALVFFIGTPPRPNDDGESFEAKRLAAIEGRSSDQFFVELSADPDADPEDRRQWAKANPSYPHRTPLVAMLRMRENIPDPASWRREALGIWDEVAADHAPPAIQPARWDALAVAEGPAAGPTAYGVKFSPSGDLVALAGAVRPDAGPIHVEGIDIRSIADGTRWLVEWLAARSAPVGIDGRSGAGAFEAALRRAGVPPRRIKRITTDEAISVAAGFTDAASAGELSHIADPALAVDDIVRRPIGKSGGWGFAGRDGQDVTLFEAAALAHWMAASKRAPRKGSGRRIALPA